MRGAIDQRPSDRRALDAAIWKLVAGQHGVIARWQLLEMGLSGRAIERRIASGRLYSVWRGVYAVGRPQLDQHGRWMAATLACGPTAVLSHSSAALLWGLGSARGGPIEVTVPRVSPRRRRGIRVHRRHAIRREDLTKHEGIPVTSAVRTLIDEARGLTRPRLERAVNEADKLDRVKVDELYAALPSYRGVPGARALRGLLDPLVFRLSDSELEQKMRERADAAGLPAPETKAWVNGFEVDFFWPRLGIVVEADGLRYHRTPLQQRRGLERDQAHTASGLRPLRFSHWQIAFEASYVQRILRKTVAAPRFPGAV
jgi:very-short-patch-repair endonuclease